MTESKHLPFDEYVVEFLDLVRNNQVVILAAETGAGKSTKAPLALLNAGFGGNQMIVVTEPRRPAATNLARWVAELHAQSPMQAQEPGKLILTASTLPIQIVQEDPNTLQRVLDLHERRQRAEIGYQIGQDKQISQETRLAYKTEGVLLAELHSDPMLKRYSVICLDEVHERGVNQDLLMALVKNVLPKRPDLKVVVMSATIDTDKFSKYFNDAPVLTVPGRMYPVEVRYAQETPEGMQEVVEAVVETVDQILFLHEPGDILVFMPDQDSIMKVVGALEKELGDRAKALRILPLFGTQAPDDQAAVFVRDERRRVIVATNIAETSLTIDGVRHVVDSGLIKAMVYVDASMSALQVTEHSRAGCDQRKGRAGRTQDGICYRLYTKADFDRRDGFTKPEILRMSLDQVLLKLRCLGYSMEEVLALDLMDKPLAEQWKDAEARLILLGALSASGEVTKDGVRMNRFHVEPMIGRMILEGEKHGCLEDVLTIAACFTATRPIFVRPKGQEEFAEQAHREFRVPTSDALTMRNAWNEWDDSKGNHRFARNHFLSSKALSQVDRIRDSLMDQLEAEGADITPAKNDAVLMKAIVAGFIANLARLEGEFSYQWKDRTTFIFPGSAVMGSTPRLVVCARVVESTTDRGTKAYMRGVQAVEPEWLADLIPVEVCNIEVRIEQSYPSFEPEFRYRRTWNGMTIESKTLTEIPQALMPHVILSIVNELQVGYGSVSTYFPQLQMLWRDAAPKIPSWGFYTHIEHQEIFRPTVEQFAGAIAKCAEGVTDVNAFVSAVRRVTGEDVLTGVALESYRVAQEKQRERERRLEQDRLAREELARRERELAARERADRERVEREECVTVRSNVIRLPKSLVEQRELIQMWLTELEEAKTALQNELAWVETLKRGVAKGEIIALAFRDRGDGFMIAEWKYEKIQAPADDLDRYPKHGESWWCHVIPGNGPTKIALCRKVGVTKVDVEKVLKDGIDMFPGLPSQLLQ